MSTLPNQNPHLGFIRADLAELHGTGPTNNTVANISGHPKGIHYKEGFRTMEGRGRVINVSKKIFRSGGMALSERTRSIRAVRDTLVADYSPPGVNTTHRVVYRPPIAVSLSLRVVSVAYFKRSLSRCGQL